MTLLLLQNCASLLEKPNVNAYSNEDSALLIDRIVITYFLL